MTSEERKTKQREWSKKYRLANLEKVAAYARGYRRKHPEKQRALNAALYEKIRQDLPAYYARQAATRRRAGWKSKGICPEKAEAVWSQFTGRCMCCGANDPRRRSKSTDPKSAWCTDHCHTTGTVRGIICHPCNLLAGFHEKYPNIISSVLTYLNKGGANV